MPTLHGRLHSPSRRLIRSVVKLTRGFSAYRSQLVCLPSEEWDIFTILLECLGAEHDDDIFGEVNTNVPASQPPRKLLKQPVPLRRLQQRNLHTETKYGREHRVSTKYH